MTMKWVDMTDDQMKWPRMMRWGWFLAICGPIMIFVASGSFVHQCFFVRNASRTQGRIVELIERNGEHGMTLAPVFVFADEKGTEHKVYSTSSSYWSLPERGTAGGEQ